MSTQTIHATQRERPRISKPAPALPYGSPRIPLRFAWGDERLPSPLTLLMPGYWLLARIARGAGDQG